MPLPTPSTASSAAFAASLVLAGAWSAVGLAAPPWTVERGPIELRLEAEGRLEAARSLAMRLVPAAFRGSLVVEEVLVEGGMVERGTVILRLDDREQREALERARLELEEANARLELTREEHRLAEEGGEVRLERARLAAERAARALERHEAIERDRRARGEALRLARTEDGVGNQLQELEQLEQMYAGTSLATETKDIVLERARRSLARARESLALTEIDHARFVEIEAPDRETDLANGARWSEQDLRHAETSQRLEAIRRRLAFAEGERKVRDLAERVEELEADLAATEVRAPATGILTPITLERGDSISPRSAFARILDVDAFGIDTTIGPQEMGWLATGATVEATLAAVPGLAVEGVVVEISPIGRPRDDGTAFPMRVELPANDPRMLLGLAATIAASHRTEPVLAVPADAVRVDGERTFVMLLRDGVEQEAEVLVGRRGVRLVEILSGVVPGDRVVVDAAGEPNP